MSYRQHLHENETIILKPLNCLFYYEKQHLKLSIPRDSYEKYYKYSRAITPVSISLVQGYDFKIKEFNGVLRNYVVDSNSKTRINPSVKLYHAEYRGQSIIFDADFHVYKSGTLTKGEITYAMSYVKSTFDTGRYPEYHGKI